MSEKISFRKVYEEKKANEKQFCSTCGDPLGSDLHCYNSACPEYDPLSQYFEEEEFEDIDTMEEDLTSNGAKALEAVRSAMERISRSADFSEIENYKDRYEFEVRYWGKWEVSDDDRNDPDNDSEDFGDWDWEVLSTEWTKKLNLIIADVNSRYNVKVMWQTGEKNWIYVSVPKNALKESQSQEIESAYTELSKKYGVDLDELVYGPEGFMQTKYPNGFDVPADVIFLEDKWNEFEDWVKETHGVDFAAIRQGENDSEPLDEVAGGKSLGLTVEDIATKHSVTPEEIEAQIAIGVEIEKEHSDDVEEARKVAMDHLVEFPDYYDRLVKMEAEAKDALEEPKVDDVEEDYSDDYDFMEDNIDSYKEDDSDEVDGDVLTDEALDKLDLSDYEDDLWGKITLDYTLTIEVIPQWAINRASRHDAEEPAWVNAEDHIIDYEYEATVDKDMMIDYALATYNLDVDKSTVKELYAALGRMSRDSIEASRYNRYLKKQFKEEAQKEAEDNYK